MSKANATTSVKDLRITDFSDRIGAYCTKLFADLGAMVTKVEPIGGHPDRQRPPFSGDDAVAGESLHFAYYHTNKQSIAIDFQQASTRPIWEKLVLLSDVVVSSFPADLGHRLGIDEKNIKLINPDAIFCSITPYGQTGPYRNARATDLTLEAMGGQMFARRSSEGIPTRIPGQQILDLASVHAAIAIIAALLARADVGGQAIDISVHEVQAAEGDLIQRFSVAGDILRPTTHRPALPTSWDATNGQATVTALSDAQRQAVHLMVGSGERSSEVELGEAISAYARMRTKEEIADEAQARRILASPVNTLGEFFRADQPRSRGFFAPFVHPTLGTVEFPGAPYVLSEPGWYLRTPAPAPGQHTDSVLGDELGFSQSQIDSWKREGLIS